MDATPEPGPALPPPTAQSAGGTGGGYTAGGPTTTRPPLFRTRSERWVAGVAGGVAAHFGVDPLIVRAAFFILALTGGVGFALYIAGWLLLPEEGESRALAENLIERSRNSPSWVPILLVVIGAGILLGQISSWGGPFVWAVLLIGAGVWLYQRTDNPHPPLPTQPPTETQPAAGSRSASALLDAEVRSAAQTTSQQLRAHQVGHAHRTTIARPRRRAQSHLGRLTVAAGLVVVGLIAMLHNTGAVTVSPKHYPAIAMVVVGSGLLIGSPRGRSRGLIFLGLLIVPFALTASFVRVPFDGGAGERTFTPASAREAAEDHHLIAGQMGIDLTGITAADWSQPVHVNATVAFGEIDVTVPADARVEVTSHVGAGSILLFGRERAGTDVDFHTADGDESSAKRVFVDAQASFGQIVVSRAAAQGTGTSNDATEPGSGVTPNDGTTNDFSPDNLERVTP